MTPPAVDRTGAFLSTGIPFRFIQPPTTSQQENGGPKFDQVPGIGILAEGKVGGLKGGASELEWAGGIRFAIGEVWRETNSLRVCLPLNVSSRRKNHIQHLLWRSNFSGPAGVTRDSNHTGPTKPQDCNIKSSNVTNLTGS